MGVRSFISSLFTKSNDTQVVINPKPFTSDQASDQFRADLQRLFPQYDTTKWTEQIALSRFKWDVPYLGLSTPDQLNVHTFWEMRQMDSQVSGLWLFRVHSIIYKGGDFRIPRKEKPTPEQEEQDAKILKFLRYVFNDYLQDGLETRLFEMIGATEWAGYSDTEKVAGYIENEEINKTLGKSVLIGWKKLFTADPRWMTEFTDIHGNLTSHNINTVAAIAAMKITVDAGIHVRIPVEKVIHCTNQQEFGNYYGQSPFRPAYQYYYAKSQIFKMRNIFLERYASPAYIGWHRNSNDQMKLKTILKTIFQGRSDVTIEAPDMNNPTMKIEPLQVNSVQGVAQAYQEAIDACNKEMSMAVLVPSLMMQEPSGGAGSRALSETHSETHMLVNEAKRRYYSHKVNHELLQDLIKWNFGSVDVMPEFFFHPIEKEGKAAISTMFSQLITGQVLSPAEKFILEILELPARDPDLYDETGKPLLSAAPSPPALPGSPTSGQEAGRLQQTGGVQPEPGEVAKEAKEHPTLPVAAAEQIAKDHAAQETKTKAREFTIPATNPALFPPGTPEQKRTVGVINPIIPDWKTLIERKDEVDIFLVDSKYIIKNIDNSWALHDNHEDGSKRKVIGGHHWALNMCYIPNDEIWISSDVPAQIRPLTITHEFEERKLMQAGLPYEEAHNIAEAYEDSEAVTRGLPRPERIVNKLPETKTKNHKPLAPVKLSHSPGSDVLFWNKMESDMKTVILGHLTDYVEHIKAQADGIVKSGDLSGVDKLKALPAKKLEKNLSGAMLNIFNETIKRETINIKTKLPDTLITKQDESDYTMDDPALEYLINHSFQTAGEIDDDILNDAKRILINGVANGKTTKQIAGELDGVFADFSQSRLNNIVRTNVMTAYSEGTRETYDDLPGLMGYRFDGIDDARQTDLCRAVDGMVIGINDPRLNEWTPPFWYECRTRITPILNNDGLEVDFEPPIGLQPWGQVNEK